ncbi:MAG: hypothetical protein GXY76_12500, partial [Chloroflexi bacterium]|nr:hypothetical protein [Chloroflexota bacterium]
KRMSPDGGFDYDVSFTGHSYRHDPVGFFNTYFVWPADQGAWNPGYDNATVSKLLLDAATELDKSKRKAMYAEAEDIMLYDEVWWLHLYLMEGFHAWSSRLKGFVPDLRGQIFDKIKYAWLES